MAITRSLQSAVLDGAGIGFRNRIINGDMKIDQRNNGAAISVTDNGSWFAADRFCVDGQVTDGVLSIRQVTTANSAASNYEAGSTPAGFTHSYKIAVTTADASIGATQSYIFRQKIEGHNIADLDWGLTTAKTVTFSFWIKCTLTGTFGGCLNNAAADRFYPFSYTINSANTWEYKTITIPGPTAGTWLKDNSIGVAIILSLGTGSTYLASTPNVWGTTGYQGVTGQTNLISTLSAAMYITGVQFEVGTAATPFEKRPYGLELELCKRYYQQFTVLPGGGSGYGALSYYGGTSSLIYQGVYWTRSSPTAAYLNNSNVQYYSYGGAWTASTPSVNIIPSTNAYEITTWFTGDGDGRGKLLRKNDANDLILTLTAEL